MNIKVIAVGKVKEKFTKDWIAEYLKRLKKYCRVEILEIKEELTLQKEAEKILDKLTDEYVIALAPQGTQLNSETFAHQLQHQLLASNILFIIGSDKGLDMSVLKQADLILSFGAMTFSHQLARVMLFEQLYRAFTIMKGEPYHK